MNDIIENARLREVLPEVKVPPATLVANPSRFTNIYERRVETILLDEETIPSQVATTRLASGRTKSLFDYTNDPQEAREGSFAATVRRNFRVGPIIWR